MSFTVKLYVTSSDHNKLTKTLTSEASFDCVLKEQSDVLHPVIRVSTSSNLSGYNYARIERYGRYYFIEKINTTPNGFWEITMKVDPLMTYASNIRGCTGTLTRSEGLYNGYLIDDAFKAYANRGYVTKAFPNAMEEDTYILMTVG